MWAVLSAVLPALLGTGCGSSAPETGGTGGQGTGTSTTTDTSSTGGTSAGCTGGTIKCGAACVDVQLDPANCGGCGKACADGEVCSNGACALSCFGGTTKCGALCVDTQLDPANCGGCAAACADGEVCSNGACALSCFGGTTKCGALCVDTQLDPANCGGCGAACADGEVCSNGACALSCAGGTTKCGALCVDTQLDPANCGGCAAACADGEVCSNGACALSCFGGTTKCGALCVDTLTNPANCGGCGNACGVDEVCSNGACALACVGGTTKCGALCVDTQLDPANCGDCGVACGADQTCTTGTCVTPTTYNDLTTLNKWSTFDMAGANAGAKGYLGSAFDERYVYLAPHNNGTAQHGLVARYDTTAAFGANGSYMFFDMTTVNAGAKGYYGAAFDERYVYFAPYNNGTSYHGLVARYDTTAAFGAAASWSTLDMTTLNGGAKGYIGAGFDGHYLYFVPNNNGTAQHGLVARYDTTAAFDAAASWSFFDMTTLNGGAKGYASAGFDGHYLYFVPHYNGAVYHGLVARYDTTAAFDAAASWSFFDLPTANASAKGYASAVFDGGNLYLVPDYNGTSFHGLVARYDTTAAFGAAASWSFLDLSLINPSARGFVGGVFDGEHVYLVPNYNNAAYDGLLARFDAKTPPSLPSLWNAPSP